MVIEPIVDFTKYGNETLRYGTNWITNSFLQKDRLLELGIKVRNNILETSDSYIYKYDPIV